MKLLPYFLALTVSAVALTPSVAPHADASTKPTPKPKISVAPKTLRAAKYRQDTMIKRSARHPEATSGTSASGENPESPAPAPAPTKPGRA